MRCGFSARRRERPAHVVRAERPDLHHLLPRHTEEPHRDAHCTQHVRAGRSRPAAARRRLGQRRRGRSRPDQARRDVNAKDDTEQSAYLIATSEGYLDLLNLTLAHGARVGAKDSWNGTGLIRAAERGHALVVGRLLQAGIDRDHVNRIGYQAIHEAVWLGENTSTYVDTIRALVAGGAELDRQSVQEGLTPLADGPTTWLHRARGRAERRHRSGPDS